MALLPLWRAPTKVGCVDGKSARLWQGEQIRHRAVARPRLAYLRSVVIRHHLDGTLTR
jgi:hypothetical protein